MLRKSANDPTQALATTAAQIAAKVVTSAMDANVSLDPAAAMLGMFEIVGELASVASAEGIYDYGQDELSAAAVRSGEILHGLLQDTGFISQEEAMTDVSELARASQTGELYQAITQLEKAGQGVGMPEDGPDAHALAMIRYGARYFTWYTFYAALTHLLCRLTQLFFQGHKICVRDTPPQLYKTTVVTYYLPNV